MHQLLSENGLSQFFMCVTLASRATVEQTTVHCLSVVHCLSQMSGFHIFLINKGAIHCERSPTQDDESLKLIFVQ